MVVEDVGSSRGESVTQVAGPGEIEFYRNPFYVPTEKCAEKCEKGEVGEFGVSPYETACVAVGLVLQSSVVGRDFIKAGGKHPMPRECAAVTAVEADDYVDVVGSSTPVHSDMEYEGFTFRESVIYAFLKNLGGVLDTSGLPLLKSLTILILPLISFSW